MDVASSRFPFVRLASTAARSADSTQLRVAHFSMHPRWNAVKHVVQDEICATCVREEKQMRHSAVASVSSVVSRSRSVWFAGEATGVVDPEVPVDGGKNAEDEAERWLLDERAALNFARRFVAEA